MDTSSIIGALNIYRLVVIVLAVHFVLTILDFYCVFGKKKSIFVLLSCYRTIGVAAVTGKHQWINSDTSLEARFILKHLHVSNLIQEYAIAMLKCSLYN